MFRKIAIGILAGLICNNQHFVKGKILFIHHSFFPTFFFRHEIHVIDLTLFLKAGEEEKTKVKVVL